MTHASLRTWWSGCARLWLLAGLFLLVLSIMSRMGMAQVPGKGGSAKGVGKGPASKTQPGGPTTLKLVLAPERGKKEPPSDVVEMVKLINDKLEESWKANKITPSFYIDDHEFIRRASLDIIGRIAYPTEIAEYMRDPVEKRRSLLIERLLSHEEYPRQWANLWANWLLTRAGDFGRGKYHNQMVIWLEDQFAQNKPYDEIATRLITAKGKNSDPNNGAVNFILAHVGEVIPRDKQREEGHFEMVPLTSRITRVFLGTQVQCAQCHAHPFFGSLKQEQFWGVNAFLRQVKREGAPMRPAKGVRPDLTLVDDEGVNGDASVFFEMRNGKVRMWQAEFLPPPGKERGPRLDPKKKGVSRREELAKYLVEHDMFPKGMVNRMWGLFMGRGFVNPTDDFNDNNQPSHPELLNELSARFKQYNFDQKKLIRWIANSNAYHLSYVANPTNDKVEHETQFSRMIMKALSPEQLFESLSAATQPPPSKSMSDAARQKLANEKEKSRNEWLAALITNFGDDEGNEITFNGTIVQALLMMNGKNINDAISAPTGTVANAISTSRSPSQVIEKLYLAALNRPPRRTELNRVLADLPLRRGFKDSTKAQYEDLFWALLNSNEFLLNH